MEIKQYIVALEIASSHIAGVVASVGGEGHRDASIVCYHEVPIVDCVRYGSIVNVDEVCGKTGMLLDRLQSDKRLAPRKIKSVYIALSGRSLCSHPIAVARDIDEQTPISKEFIGRIEREAAAQVEKADVLAVMPCKYELDGVEVANPIDSLGAHLCIHECGDMPSANQAKHPNGVQSLACRNSRLRDCPDSSGSCFVDGRRTPFGLHAGRSRSGDNGGDYLQKQSDGLCECHSDGVAQHNERLVDARHP